jgi:hypothetical protein
LVDDGIYHQGKVLENYFTLQAVDLGLLESQILLSDPDAKLANSFLDKIIKMSEAVPFLYPVDRVMYPDYYVKIKSPVDISTIRDRIQEYESLDDFEKDFKLLISNCFVYNAKGSVGLCAWGFNF